MTGFQKASLVTALGILEVLLGSPSVAATIVIRARAFDGAASAEVLSEAIRATQTLDDSLKVPLADAELTVRLVALGDESAGRPPSDLSRWECATDTHGNFTVDTGLETVPPGAVLAASAQRNGSRLYSPWFLPRTGPEGSGDSDAAEDSTDGSTAEPLPVHLYPITGSPLNVRADFKVAYDLLRERTGEAPGEGPVGAEALLRVRVGLRLLNAGGEMYVGRESEGPGREVWRLPLPPGARIIDRRGPQPGGQGWRVSTDRKWLVLDTPIPGLCDVDVQGTWEVHYTVPARQTLVQTYPLPLPLEAQQATAWASEGDMELLSEQLSAGDSGVFPDPLNGAPTRLLLLFNPGPLQAGRELTVAVSVDNAALGQVSHSAVKWVGSFILLLLVALLVGLALGPGPGRPRDNVAAGDSGTTESPGDPVDRIIELDALRERGEIGPEEFRQRREALLTLLARELGGPEEGPEEDPEEDPEETAGARSASDEAEGAR